MKNKIYMKIKQYLLQYTLFEKIKHVKVRYTNKNRLEYYPDLLEDGQKLIIDWPTDVTKPKVGLVKDYEEPLITHRDDCWPKYQRYLQYNEIPYKFFDVYRSDWIEEAKTFDIVVWRTASDPATQRDAKSKIYIIENYLGKLCFPGWKELWLYEDKVRQHYLFKINKIPSVETFVSNSKQEVLDFVETTEYPIVSKITTGSGSLGVELIKNKRTAIKYVNRIFAPGRNTYWTYLKQKDYVYFQKFIHDAFFDLRVIVVANKYFGYYRKRPTNDFRASGAGLIEKKEIPKEALLIAKDLKEKLGTTIVAVDMIKSKTDCEYKVIEASLFIRAESAQQLKIKGVPGYYEYCDGDFTFKPGKYWTQELALNEVLKSWISNAKPRHVE